MKMLKGLEIMGLKQIQNAESVKKGARLAFFGNLLSGFMFNQKTNPKKPNLNIAGTHFLVKNQPSAKTTSSKDAPVFIRPGAKKAPTMENLDGLLKKNSSGNSENDLDAKSEVLILRALSAAFVKPSGQSTAPPSVKDSESKTLRVQLKKIGNKPVLVLSVKNAAKMETIQKFVSKIETAAAKNQIELPVIQVKALPQIQKPSQQAKAAGKNKEKTTSEKHPSKTKSSNKNQLSEKEILNSKPQKGNPDISSMPVKHKQTVSKQRVGAKEVSTVLKGKELKTAEINQPVLKKKSVPPPDAKGLKSDVQVSAKKIKQEPFVKTQFKAALKKGNPAVKVNKSTVSSLKNKQTQTVSKNRASVQKAIPVRAKTQINEEKSNRAIPNQKSTPLVLKAQAEAPKQQPQKIDRQVRKTIKNGTVHISQEKTDNVKPSTVKTNHIKTQTTKIAEDVRPKQNSEIRFTNAPQKGKVFQKTVSRQAPSTIGAKAELLQQHNMGSVKKSVDIQEKAGTAVKNQPKETIGFTPLINKNSVKPKRENGKKEESTPAKQFINSKVGGAKSHKLHDFSEKSSSKSGSGQFAKSETETVLEFGKQGSDKNAQKDVSQAGMTNGTQASREIQVPVKFAPLVSRMNELIQKFKASAKQSSVKTSFRVAAGGAGEVEIQLDEKTKEKTIKIRVESDKVRNELQKTLPQIQQNLLLKGIEFSSIAIETAPFGSKMNQTQDQKRGTQNSKSKQPKEVQNDQEQPAVIQKKYGYNTIEVIA